MSTARRGRPKSSSIPDLMREGELGQGPYKCPYCYRLFPRMKSLHAHIRIHTGETPYLCRYPGCGRNFKQSGQLKTHVRRHTGEKPFVCKFSGCPQRYLHSSRKCPNHPTYGLTKDNREVVKINENHTEAEIRWLNESRIRLSAGQGSLNHSSVWCRYQASLGNSSRKSSNHLAYRLIKDNREVVKINENHTEAEIRWLNVYKENKDKPVKRKTLTNSQEVFRQSKTVKSNSPSPSALSVASGGYGSSESGISSCSDASRDSNISSSEQRNPQEPQAAESRFFMSVDPKALEAAEILCMFSKLG